MFSMTYGSPIFSQQVAHRADEQVGVVTVVLVGACVPLTWRAGVDGCEVADHADAEGSAYRGEVPQYVHGVDVVELERVPRLWVVVDADHVEPGAVVTHASTASAAEQVEEQRPRHDRLRLTSVATARMTVASWSSSGLL